LSRVRYEPFRADDIFEVLQHARRFGNPTEEDRRKGAAFEEVFQWATAIDLDLTGPRARVPPKAYCCVHNMKLPLFTPSGHPGSDV
jgi:hypothetical protein